jgi:hypothetical protein
MANTIIQIRSSGVSGNIPSTLQPGELAINYFDGQLFYGNTLSQAVPFTTVTEPSGLDGEIQFNDSGSFGSDSELTFNKSTGLLSATVLKSTQSSGDEGGQLDLSTSQTNNLLSGGAVSIDIYQNKLRFFESGGAYRGVYIDLANGASSGVGTNLLNPAAASYANSAYIHANSAYEYANALSGGTATDGVARNLANTANSTAQAAFDKANTSAGAVLVTSNVNSVSSGATIAVAIDMANVSYPGGIFTIYQQDAYVLTVTNAWQSGSANKNAYSNLAANIVNTQNISLSISLTDATFNIQTGDTITIGSSVVTGANLLALGISSTGGSYTIPSSYLLSNVQTNSTSTVSASLTTSRGVATDTGTTLTNTQATPFAVSSISASFPSSTVPYFSKNQTFSWSASVTGTVVSGNVAYSGDSSGTLTSSGATSGTSGSLDSTQSYTVSSSDYRGTGLNGAGTRTIPSTVSRVITSATSYIPLFYKTTSSSSNPNFTTSDTYITSQYTLGQGANTTSTESNYLWIAVPGTDSHEFAFTFLGTPVVVEPATTYTGQTISGQSYNVYGFTNFSEVTNIYTTS